MALAKVIEQVAVVRVLWRILLENDLKPVPESVWNVGVFAFPLRLSAFLAITNSGPSEMAEDLVPIGCGHSRLRGTAKETLDGFQVVFIFAGRTPLNFNPRSIAYLLLHV